MSGLRETFTKRYKAERTNRAEIRPDEQSETAERCWENLWKEIQLKGPSRRTQTKEENNKEWASSAGLCQKHKLQHPRHVEVSPWGQPSKRQTDRTDRQ